MHFLKYLPHMVAMLNDKLVQRKVEIKAEEDKENKSY